MKFLIAGRLKIEHGFEVKTTNFLEFHQKFLILFQFSSIFIKIFRFSPIIPLILITQSPSVLSEHSEHIIDHFYNRLREEVPFWIYLLAILALIVLNVITLIACCCCINCLKGKRVSHSHEEINALKGMNDKRPPPVPRVIVDHIRSEEAKYTDRESGEDDFLLKIEDFEFLYILIIFIKFLAIFQDSRYF